jgi:hypothetical protein
MGGDAEVVESRSGRKLLRIRITAEVDGVKSEYAITFDRDRTSNEAKGYVYASTDAPGGRETNAERYLALFKALTGREPTIIELSNGKIEVECGREHLDGFRRYAELADAIMKWLRETGR